MANSKGMEPRRSRYDEFQTNRLNTENQYFDSIDNEDVEVLAVEEIK